MILQYVNLFGLGACGVHCCAAVHKGYFTHLNIIDDVHSFLESLASDRYCMQSFITELQVRSARNH